MFKSGQAVTKDEPLVRLDDQHQRLAVQLAEVTVKEARRRVEHLAPSGATSVAGLLTAQSELESALLNQARAQAALADRTITAPFDGGGGLTATEPGDRVDEKTPIATLDDRSSNVVQFNLPEAYAGLIKVDDRVTVQPWTMRGIFLPGTVSELDRRILVDGPLKIGDAIVVEGVQGLRVGQPIAAKPLVRQGG